MISDNIYYLGVLNKIGIEFMYKEQWNLSYAFLINAEIFANRLALKKEEARAKYNLACLFSLKKELEKSKEYLISSLELNPEHKDNWKDDPDLKNLRNSRFNLP